MDAAILIGLEGTFAELGELYEVARQFTPLAERAETELLGAIESLGARLRRLLRTSRLGTDEVEQVGAEILALRDRWQRAVDEIRTSPVYLAATGAFAADRVDDLHRWIPQIFAELTPAAADVPMFLPISVSTGRRRPGTTPFLSADDCAERIVEQCRNGIAATPGSGWWEQDFPGLQGVDDPEALDTPISLQLRRPTRPYALFVVGDGPFLRACCRSLEGDFAAVVAGDTNDQWWEAHEQPYPAFRDGLIARLEAAGIAVHRHG